MKLRNRIAAFATAIMAVATLSSCNYNSLVEKEQTVEQSWAEVETQYQRRADLIPNLVNTVKGYAEHESKTLESVVAARAKATSITLSADDLTEENLAKYQQAQGELSGALKSLLSTARTRYTQAVKDYNTAIKKFPTVIYAGWFGFEEKPQFKAEAGAESAPEVNFNE